MKIKDKSLLKEVLVFPADVDSSMLLDLIALTGAILKGHFQLQSGRHADHFLRFSQIGWDAPSLAKVTKALLDIAPFAKEPATVICAETSSLFLGRSVAEATEHPLAVAAVDVHRRPTKTLRFGAIVDDNPVLIVTDVATTGESLKRLRDLAPPIEGRRSTGMLAFATNLTSGSLQPADEKCKWLVGLRWPTYASYDCPMCREGVPLLQASELN